MRMYSTSCGTISSSHRPLTNRERRVVSIGNSRAIAKGGIVSAPSTPPAGTDAAVSAGAQARRAGRRVVHGLHRHPSGDRRGHSGRANHGSSHASRRIAMLRSLFAAALALALALPAFAATPININKADASAIASSLDGVGEAKAKAIVAWRDAHGPFKTLDDLAQVKGMGPATLKRNSDAIQFSGNAAGAPAKAAKAKGKTKAKASAK